MPVIVGPNISHRRFLKKGGKSNLENVKLKILSVQHTGTRFLFDVLDRAGVDYVHAHFGWGERFEEVAAQDQWPTVIPVRKMENMIEGYNWRKKPIADLEVLWEEMLDFMKTHETLLFRIDDPEHREGDLQALSDLVGVPLTADWDNKIGHHKG